MKVRPTAVRPAIADGGPAAPGPVPGGTNVKRMNVRWESSAKGGVRSVERTLGVVRQALSLWAEGSTAHAAATGSTTDSHRKRLSLRVQVPAGLSDAALARRLSEALRRRLSSGRGRPG